MPDEQRETWRPLTEDTRFFLTRVHTLGDIKRRMIIGLDMAGIVSLGALASWFWTEQKISPGWTLYSFVGFLLSLILTYRAMDMSELEAESYLEAAYEGEEPVECGPFHRAAYWGAAAYLAFVVAIVLAAWQLVEVTSIVTQATSPAPRT